MVLYKDLTLEIELYNDLNVLNIEWFEQTVFRMSDFEFSFHIVMENIVQYRIKKILVKTSNTIIHLPNEEYLSVIGLLQSGLAHSRIRKIAKLFIDKSPRDLECKQFFKDMLNEMQLEIDFRNFDTKAEALAWLKEDPAALKNAS